MDVLSRLWVSLLKLTGAPQKLDRLLLGS